MSEAKRRVFVVDDDPDFRLQQRLQLESAGYDVVEASSLKEARKLLPSTDFDVALVDLMMEDTDAGFALCRDIKAKGESIPVILVTAVAAETGLDFSVTSRDERAWVRADVLLDKPVRFEQLLREMNRLLKD